MKTLISLSLLLIGGHYAGKIAEKIKLPKLIGMIIFGCIIGPAYLNQIDSLTLHMSKELKSIALVTVLITGGLGISTEQLKKWAGPLFF